MKKSRGGVVPQELQQAVAETSDRLEERLDKCYSAEDYAHFQEEVKKIILEVIGHDDGKAIIKPTAKEAARDWVETEGWKRKTFWIPTIIAGVAAIAAIFAALK